ncbi:unnamed protein product, partial [Meganyctiphanes norvegica]
RLIEAMKPAVILVIFCAASTISLPHKGFGCPTTSTCSSRGGHCVSSLRQCRRRAQGNIIKNLCNGAKCFCCIPVKSFFNDVGLSNHIDYPSPTVTCENSGKEPLGGILGHLKKNVDPEFEKNNGFKPSLDNFPKQMDKFDIS